MAGYVPAEPSGAADRGLGSRRSRRYVSDAAMWLGSQPTSESVFETVRPPLGASRHGCWPTSITGKLVEVEASVRRRSFAAVVHGPGRRESLPRTIGAALPPRLAPRQSVRIDPALGGAYIRRALVPCA